MESFLSDRIKLYSGNCLSVLDGMEENSLDSCVCDPPYHLTSIVKRFGGANAVPAQNGTDGAFARQSRGFMNTIWDGGDVAFRVETWAKVYRVLKPGAFITAFASTRRFGRMSVAIEDAGFITHPFIAWIFATGFPKATRVKLDGWEGWRYGTQALKPALEPIYVGQKPFEKGLTGTENIAKWGTGAINIGACRVNPGEVIPGGGRSFGACDGVHEGWRRPSHADYESKPAHNQGRWPANIIHDGSDEVIAAFPETSASPKGNITQGGGAFGSGAPRGDKEFQGHGDSGSAARFFYSSKADSDDRLGSKHPTVKPVDLMQYLCRLVTPKNGTILDPFSGTGTTGEAAFREGFNAVLIEREAEYQADIRRRMALCMSGHVERKHESIKAKTKDQPADHGPLFADITEDDPTPA